MMTEDYWQALDAYRRKFGDEPKFYTFLVPREAYVRFAEAMQMAVERGRKLTERETRKAYEPEMGMLEIL